MATEGQQFGYGIPHYISSGTRHEAIGQAAIMGRRFPNELGGSLKAIKAVIAWTTSPPNRRKETL